MELSLRFFITAFGLLLSGAIGNCDIFVYRQDPPRLIMDEFRDMPASFGPKLSPEGMRAYLVPGEPPNGCFSVTPPPNTASVDGNWVVLLMRYGCSFEDKIRNAQAAGFDGVIVHNVKSDDLESMSAKNSSGILIPAVFVSETDGLILYNYSYIEHYFIVINGDVPFNINTRLLVPFAIVVMLCLFIMVVFLVVKCVRERRRARRHCLPSSSLKKIPICKFQKGDPYDTCAICLDDYVEGDKLRVLPCAHAYHCKCIDPWLTKNRRVCPVCKRKVFASGERPNRRSNRNSEARSAHENQSDDSDTGDDRAPLINSRSSEQSTQGGTFQRQRENPFVRATRTIVNERNTASGSSEPRLAQSESCPDSSGVLRGGPFLTGVLNLRGDQFSSRDVEDETNLYTDVSATIRNSSIRTSTERERSRAKSSRQPSNENNPKRTRKSGHHSSHNRKRRSSDTAQPSSNPDRSHPEPSSSVSVQPNLQNPSGDQGMIGVAALPNVEIQGEQQQSRRNDFVI